MTSGELVASLPQIDAQRDKGKHLDLVRGIVHAKAVPLPALGAVLVSASRQPGFSLAA